MPTLTIRHVTTYRYRRPVAFGEHRMMLRPRDSHDQRVIGASLEISPEPRSLHFVQDAFGNHVGIARFSGRSKELCFESIVCLEQSRGPRKGLSRRLSRRRDAGPRPLHRTPSPRSGERGWPLGSSIPAPGRVERIRMVAQECPPVLGWRCSASDHRLLPVGASAPTF